MPMAIWMDIDAMWRGMEPVVRSLMESGGLRQKKKPVISDRLSRYTSVGRWTCSDLTHSPQGSVVVTPTRKRGSLLFTSSVTLNSSASVPVNLPKIVKLLTAQLSCTE